MRMPNYPPGVPSQYSVHVHPWPTRYHGPIYTRPTFGLPYVRSPYAVFKPGDFSATATAGFGADAPAAAPAPAAPAESSAAVYPGVTVLGNLLGVAIVAGIMYFAMRKS